MTAAERRLRNQADSMWMVAGGAACLGSGGADTPEAKRWRLAYQEARMGDARDNIMRVLEGPQAAMPEMTGGAEAVPPVGRCKLDPDLKAPGFKL